MKLKLFTILVFLPSILYASTTEINAYDPFADYSEFENTTEEQDNINFFQNGRSLSIGALGGAQLFTQNMANLYNIGPVYGGYISYFFDLHFAIQFEVIGSSHYVNSVTAAFVGQTDFVSVGVDFKYFVNRTLFHKNLQWLAPFFFLGALHSTQDLVATLTQQAGAYQDSGYGVNVGVGLEFRFSKKVHIGIQYSFQYVTLQNEAVPINLKTRNGNKNSNIVPYGDWMHITMLLGVNF